MTLIAAIPASTSILALLANSAARALALSGVAGLGLVAFRVKTTTVRLFTWTAVLYAALAMPLLQWTIPPVPVPTPAILQSRAAQPRAAFQHASATGETVPVHEDEPGLARSNEVLRSGTSASRVNHNRPSSTTARTAAGPANSASFLSSVLASLLARVAQEGSWGSVAAGLYFAIALLLLARFCVGLAFSRRLAHAAQLIDDPRVTARMTSRAHASGLASTPQMAESELISVPLTMGVLHPTILLPTDWREWDDAKLDAVVAHEVSHVARRDSLTQRISLLHCAIFWFSPLAWWLDPHLADIAEQASDEAALAYGADREDYARTLLGFFEALQVRPGRVWWQGVAMAKAGQAEKRLERILSWKGSVAMRLKKSIVLVVVTLAVPVVYLAASVHAASQSLDAESIAVAQNQTSAPAAAPEATPPAAESTEITPAPAAITGTVSGGISGGVSGGVPVAAIRGVPPVAGIAGVAPIAPFVPVPPAWRGQSDGSGPSSSNGRSYGRGHSYSYGYDDDQRFVIVTGSTDSLTMSGSVEDARHVEKLRKWISGDFIWFQSDEKSYIIRDQATIDRARKLWAPQEELGKKQEELGKQQEVLGKQQEELGAKMEQIHVNVPDMTAELDKLKAELKKLSAGATAEQVGEVQSEIGDLQSKIGDIQSQAGDQQSKLGEQMSALGEKQGKLGDEQGRLGEQQSQLAREASRQMKMLLDEAIAKGIAQPEL